MVVPILPATRLLWIKWRDVKMELWTIYTLHFGYYIPFHHLPPVTWEQLSSHPNSWEFLAQALHWGRKQNTVKGHAAFCSKIFLLETCHWLIPSQQQNKIEDGGSSFDLGLCQEGGHHFLHWLEGYLSSNSNPPRPFLKFALERMIYQVKSLYFSLSTALQVFSTMFALVLTWPHQGIRSFLTEWSLLPWMFGNICSEFGHPHIDLCTTRVNMNLLIFVSPIPDPGVWKEDTF